MATSPKATHPKARRFLLARHGQTNYNKEHRVQGTLDTPVLDYEGIAQASSLGVYIADRQRIHPSNTNITQSTSVDSTKEPPITRTYCSPMQRCRQTYAAVSGVCSGHAANKPTSHAEVSHYTLLPDPTILSKLHEIELCEWQGRLRKDVAVNDAENWNVFKEAPAKLRLNKGGFAPVIDCWERAGANWEVIRAESKQEDAEVVFIMCHGAIGQALLLRALGLDIELYGKSKRFAFDNCDCFEVEWCDGESASKRWRKVYRGETKWEKCTSTRKMYSSELESTR